jgi:hypothetical protein
MQALAVFAVALVVIMFAGVSATLIWARHRTQPLPGGLNRWQLHGCIPLGLGGLVLGVVSRGSGQAPGTHQVLFFSAGALLLGGLLCALAGAVSGTRQQRAARQ